MNMFNTNSTTVMQSKLLLGLGIDPRTADLTLHDEERDIPLWSMMRLIDMIPGFIVDDDGYTYSFTISKGHTCIICPIPVRPSMGRRL